VDFVAAIDATVELVKDAPGASTGLSRLLALCRRVHPDPLWDALPAIDAKADVRAARAWLAAQLGSPTAPVPTRGLYLGLDTLNMAGDDGYNVELAATSEEPAEGDLEWTGRCEWYGTRHLIAGLRALNAEYQQPRWSALYEFADYVLVLGYSGLVLADALAELPVSEPLLAAWGFHDGDMFQLGKRSERMFLRLGNAY
jgi:hypothetical protein